MLPKHTHTHTQTHTHTHTQIPTPTCFLLFWLVKLWSCIKLCQEPALSRQVQWSITLDQAHILSSIYHQNWTTLPRQNAFEVLTWLSVCIRHLRRFISDRYEMRRGLSTRWTHPRGTLTITKEEISRRLFFLMYMELFILHPLFTDASHDTSQLRRFASVALRSNAQLTMKGIPRMDGRLLIKCFYAT